jgi:hypothetical protein
MRYEQSRTFWEQNHGLGLDEYIVNNGLLRSDGKTLIAQPSLNTERMWTIEDARAWGMEITDPMVAIRAQLAGASNGSASNRAGHR